MSVKRKSLLIANPGKDGSDEYCKGVFSDVENFKNFLLSPIGGLWKHDEIDTMIKPLKSKLLESIALLRDVDYALVVFSGHGSHSSQLDETILKLNDSENMSSKKLREGAAKQTLILDCCRVIYDISLPELSKYIFDKTFNQVDSANCRLYYDKRIEECPKALTVLYSCDINETAGETSRGGYFTYNFINSSRNWASKEAKGINPILSVVQAFELASKAVNEVSIGRQNPQLEKPRLEKHFPICVAV
jgi:hypothetical protein